MEPQVEIAQLRVQARRANMYSTMQMLALAGGAAYLTYPLMRVYLAALRRRL